MDIHLLCVRNGHTEVAMALIDKGADVNSDNNSRNTPLRVMHCCGMVILKQPWL